jgi:hypothetical protein
MHSDLSGSPGDGVDNYPLVSDYNAPGNPHPGPYSDDHNINNVNDILTTWNPENSEYGNEFIEKIAWYTDNDGCQSGSNHVGSTPTGIYNGFIQWIEDTNLIGFYDIINYDVKDQNAFEEIVEYIMGGSGVLLNLGYYTESGSYNENHWVSVAGVSHTNLQIALSDPYVDSSNYTNDYTIHNDAGIVSHDIYTVSTNSPFPQHSSWWLEDYVPDYAQDSLTLVKNAIIIKRNTNTAKPEKPTISGPPEGKAGEEYTYTASTTDPDGDQIFYLFDWGDGSTSFILGPYESGAECNTVNIWFEEDNYEIKVKAIDENNAESEWSDPLSITMPKTNNKFLNIFHQFLTNHPMLYKLLHYLEINIF